MEDFSDTHNDASVLIKAHDKALEFTSTHALNQYFELTTIVFSKLNILCLAHLVSICSGGFSLLKIW